MEVIVRKIKDANNQEIGVILNARVNSPTDLKEKTSLEKQLKEYALSKIYPDGGHIYSEMNYDTPSIVVLKDINSLPQSIIRI